jgi:hypothetical protein
MEAKVVLAGVVLLLIALPSAAASSWCVNGTTRAFEDVYNINDSDNLSVITIGNHNDYCTYGCSGGRCLEGNSGDSTSLVVLFMLISFGFLYLGLNIHAEEMAALSYIFIPLGITFMAVAIFALGNTSVFGLGMNVALGGSMLGLLVVLIFVIALFLMFTVTKAFEKMPYGKKRYDGKPKT